MTNMDAADGCSRQLRDDVDEQSDGGAPGDPALPGISPPSVEATQISTDVPPDVVASLIRERLEEHPHFRGRISMLQIESIGGSVVLSGRLPTYYLKQLLQEAVRRVPDVKHIDNRVEVTFP